MTDNNRYPAEVFWSENDDGFIAVAPDLPGCSAFGLTQQEALTELQDAIAAWIEAAQSAGNSIPEPSDPAKQADYSGKVLLRMPRDLHARLARLAKIEAVSLNQCIVYLLTSASTYRSIEIGTLHPLVTGYSGQQTTFEFNPVMPNLGTVYTFAGGGAGIVTTGSGPGIAVAGSGRGVGVAVAATATALTFAGHVTAKALRQEAEHG